MDEFDFEPAPAAAGRGRGRGAGRCAQEKAAARGRGVPAVFQKCAVPSCPKPVKPKKRFCDGHLPTWGNMVYQAKNKRIFEEDGSIKMDPMTGKPANKLAQFNEAMKDDTSAGQAVEQQSVEEPADSRYRKHKFIDWGRFERVYGNRAEV